MSFASQFQVPGGFNFDTSTSPAQPLHANIFRPPPSPSSSSYNLGKSTGSLFSDISMSNAQPTGTAKRKRTSTRESMPFGWQKDGANDGREEEKSREFRYTLAGQISTTPAGPPAGVENGMLDDSVYSDVDYRRALGPKTLFGEESPGAAAPNRMTTSTTTSAGWSFFSLQTLGDMVGKVWEFCKKGAFRGFHAGGGQGYNVNGSTVTETTGKPWGPGSPESETLSHTPEDAPMKQEPPAYFPQPAQSAFSPAYYDVSTPESTPRPAAKRRQVSANTNDELKNWVVVDEPNEQPKRLAGESKQAGPRPSMLARPRSGYYSQTSATSHRRISTPSQRFTGGTPTFSRSAATRPSLRISHAGSPALTPREPASFASPRSSPAYGSTPSRIPVPVQPSPTQVSHNPNPFAIPGTTTIPTAPLPSSIPTLKTSASRPSSRHSPSRHTTRHSLGTTSTTTNHLRPTSPSKLSFNSSSSSHHRRNQSSASTTRTRRHSTLENIQATSPRLDAEARQLAQRKLAAERDADARVDAFNARLLSMIRQGREALGTKVEVDMLDDVELDFKSGGGGGGGGWEDDD
ncbi:hypothetical protein VTI74DRAFT_7318 [Chaetomium olivicolor]